MPLTGADALHFDAIRSPSLAAVLEPTTPSAPSAKADYEAWLAAMDRAEATLPQAAPGTAPAGGAEPKLLEAIERGDLELGPEVAPPTAAEDAAKPSPGWFLDKADASYGRLNELIGQLDGKSTFSPQELLRVQLEVSKITLQLETTTKAVSEAVSDVKQLFQQQL